MTFGEKVRRARQAKNYDLRTLAGLVGVHFTYLSKVENGRLDFGAGDYPSGELIGKLAEALDLDHDELLLLAQKIPERIRRRVLERPDVFLALAYLDDRTLDRLVAGIGVSQARSSRNAEH